MSDEEPGGSLEIRALTDPGLREAIGGVCVHWALLELTVERALSHIVGDAGVLRYAKDLGANLQHLRSAVEKSIKFDVNQKAEIHEVIGQIECLRPERHRVAHGLWGKDSNGVIHSIFPALKRNVDPVKPMTVEDIRQTKLSIFFVGKALRRFIDPSDEVQILWDKD